jgi:hypothetical protein
MADQHEAQFTHTDIEVGARLVEALIRHAVATGGEPIGYADLLTLGRNMHSRDAVLARAVPVGIGMKLRFVAEFCAAHGYPDLASLAVPLPDATQGKGSGNSGETARNAVAVFDWSAAPGKLAEHIVAMRAKVPKRFKPRQERPADVAWYAYFCSHRAACANITADDKKEVINLLMAGLDPETALRQVMNAKANSTISPHA